MGWRDPDGFDGVPREQVLKELASYGVDVSEVGEHTYLLRKDTRRIGLQEKTFVFPPIIRKRMLQELRHRFEADLSFDLRTH
jgi:hypothetical protein